MYFHFFVLVGIKYFLAAAISSYWYWKYRYYIYVYNLFIQQVSTECLHKASTVSQYSEQKSAVKKTDKNLQPYRNYYKGHMDKIKGEGGGGGGG